MFPVKYFKLTLKSIMFTVNTKKIKLTWNESCNLLCIWVVFLTTTEFSFNSWKELKYQIPERTYFNSAVY